MRRRAVLFAPLAALLPVTPVRAGLAPRFGYPVLGCLMGSAVGPVLTGGPAVAPVRAADEESFGDGAITGEWVSYPLGPGPGHRLVAVHAPNGGHVRYSGLNVYVVGTVSMRLPRVPIWFSSGVEVLARGTAA